MELRTTVAMVICCPDGCGAVKRNERDGEKYILKESCAAAFHVPTADKVIGMIQSAVDTALRI